RAGAGAHRARRAAHAARADLRAAIGRAHEAGRTRAPGPGLAAAVGVEAAGADGVGVEQAGLGRAAVAVAGARAATAAVVARERRRAVGRTLAARTGRRRGRASDAQDQPPGEDAHAPLASVSRRRP